MRFKNSILNMLAEFIPQLILMIIGFVKIELFINVLGSSINGFNSTISQILNYLMLVEGGFGISLIQMLYKPLADKNTKKVKELYLGSEKILKFVGIAIFAISLIIAFFLPSFTEGVLSPFYAVGVFYIFVIPTVFSYFMMAPTLVVSADQKNYKINVILKSLSIIRGILQVIFLYMGLSYLTLVIVDGLVIFLQYFLSRRVALKEYPYLKDTNGLTADLSALTNTKHVFVHKVSSIVKSSSSNIVLLSVFPGEYGLILCSIYNSYYYIISMFTNLLGGIFNAPKESFGNLIVSDKEKLYPIFKEYVSISYFITTTISIVTFITIGTFVFYWIKDPAYIRGTFVSFCFTYILFEALVRIPIHNIRDAAGLFKESRSYAIGEAVINLSLAFLLVSRFDISGLLFATVISSIISGFYLNPRLVYQSVFNLSVWRFYKDIGKMVLIMIIVGSLSYCLWNFYFLNFISNIFIWFVFAGLLFIFTALLSLGSYWLIVPEFKFFVLRFANKLLKK